MFKLLVFVLVAISAVASQTIDECCDNCMAPLTPQQMEKLREGRIELGLEKLTIPNIFDAKAMQKSKQGMIQLTNYVMVAMELFTSDKLELEKLIEQAMSMGVARKDAEDMIKICAKEAENTAEERQSVPFYFGRCFFKLSFLAGNHVDSQMCRNTLEAVKNGNDDLIDGYIYKVFVSED